MFNMINSFIFLSLLTTIVLTLAFILSKKSNLNFESMSPFECGFDPKMSARLPFSLHFFLIMIIFLIFDIEISIIIPMILTFNTSNLMFWYFINIAFFFILLIGVYLEWYQNFLKWTF